MKARIYNAHIRAIAEAENCTITTAKNFLNAVLEDIIAECEEAICFDEIECFKLA